MHYLFPLTALVLVAGLLGKGASGATLSSGKTVLYQGLVDGPNMFGSMAAMCVPFLAWQLYCHRGGATFRYWVIATVCIVVLIVLSGSRAAFGVAALTLGGCLLSMPTDAKRKAVEIGLAAGLASGFLVSDIGDRVSSFIYKFDSKEEGLLYTRERVWEQSYENAKAGGWTGAGYGVTIGAGKFKGGITAIGYGREKGSTWLALAEETGIIGVILFSCLVLGLLNSLIRTLVESRDHDYRVLLGIVSGAVVGMVFLSFFEGWWVAPGSPESGCFWVLCGIGIGLVERSDSHQAPISVKS
jgi:O-antigen ligase